MSEEVIIFICAVIVTALCFFFEIRIRKNHQKDFESFGMISTPNGEGRRISLTTVNGIGMGLSGKFREGLVDNVPTYVSYYSLLFFYLPIIPFKAYRVIESDGGYVILGSEPTILKEIGLTYLKILAWIALIVTGIFLLMIILK